MYKCSYCKTYKDASHYRNHSKNKRGLQYVCRECNRVLDRIRKKRKNDIQREIRKSLSVQNIPFRTKRPNEILICEDYAVIRLNDEVGTKIDIEDIDLVKDYHWTLNQYGYAEAYVPMNEKCKKMRLHRLVMKTPDGIIVDHINHDKLDNRKSSLRHVTNSQNLQNQKVRKGNKSSKYKGVSWSKSYKLWAMQIKLNSVIMELKHFKTEREAALEYNRYAHKYFGEYAFFNVIQDD